jgi:hypothetical protein
MTEYLIFGRTEYAEPLALVTTVEADSAPTLDELDAGTDWLELVAVPRDAVIWIERDGELVTQWAVANA